MSFITSQKLKVLLATTLFWSLLCFSQTQDSAVNKLPQNLVRQLLILMDSDQSGQISKEEFMAYMSYEFDKLDTNKSGQLDISELKALRYKPNSSHTGGGSK
jgi:Ca2+-binding EF-hand superfamily protein